jgi:hypothetical protein
MTNHENHSLPYFVCGLTYVRKCNEQIEYKYMAYAHDTTQRRNHAHGLMLQAPVQPPCPPPSLTNDGNGCTLWMGYHRQLTSEGTDVR